MATGVPNSNPLDILIEHDRWATRNILETCAHLADDEFHQSFQIGPGSLHDTLSHILGAQRAWTDVLCERDPIRFKLEEGKRSVPALIKLHDDIAEGFELAIHDHPFTDTVSPERAGQTFTFTRGSILTHVTTHGMHHRAQCLNMLRQLRVDPLPHNSVVEWMLATGAATTGA